MTYRSPLEEAELRYERAWPALRRFGYPPPRRGTPQELRDLRLAVQELSERIRLLEARLAAAAVDVES